MENQQNLIVIKCPACGQRLSFKPVPNYRQKRVTCPKCRHADMAGNFDIVSDPSRVQMPATTDARTYGGATVTLRCLETGETFPLKPGRNVLGRKAATGSADIQIADEHKYISKVHASITVVNNGGNIQLHLRDENSTNGTGVGGKKMPRGSVVMLQPDTRFTMGQLNFVCTVGNQAYGAGYDDSEDTVMN